ncbi:DUF6062 family protein [Lachnospiraceae bacterium OttesenSCG-928-D06]|nr:DUF6062 family protein [Lachnospiraceae bacterium OttesenSCG-928-D06]
MKEQLYTIPLNDAVNAMDECPFCYIERNVEQDLLDFVLGSGSSYMEADIREMTDKAGFCRSHFKKMFDYGNTLGNAWILKTHYQKMIQEMQEEFAPLMKGKGLSGKPSFRNKFLKATSSDSPVSTWVQKKEESCYVCKGFKDTYARYLDTFFYMYKKDEDFKQRIESSRGFCLPHFRDLCEGAEVKLNDKEKEEFYSTMLPLMIENMKRVAEDVSWMVEKFDYRNKDADWKDSKDSLQRGMQKLKGGYPADSVYSMKK